MKRKELVEELSRIIGRAANSGTVEEANEAVERVLEEFYVIPRDSSLPLPAAVHAAMLAVINSEQTREDK